MRKKPAPKKRRRLSRSEKERRWEISQTPELLRRLKEAKAHPERLISVDLDTMR